MGTQVARCLYVATSPMSTLRDEVRRADQRTGWPCQLRYGRTLSHTPGRPAVAGAERGDEAFQLGRVGDDVDAGHDVAVGLDDSAAHPSRDGHDARPGRPLISHGTTSGSSPSARAEVGEEAGDARRRRRPGGWRRGRCRRRRS